jgi:hypothetical protein
MRYRLVAHSFTLFEQDRGSDEEARDLQAARETAQSATGEIPVTTPPEDSGIVEQSGENPERPGAAGH